MNIKEIKQEFESMPTIPPTEDTLSFIDKILEKPELSHKDRFTYAEIFFDLITCLIDNYAHLTSEQSEKIIVWIENNWNEKNVEYTDLLISIAINTNALAANKFLNKMLILTRKKQISKMLSDALEEISVEK